MYWTSDIAANDAIRLLKIKSWYNQYCFLSETGLEYLKFLNSFAPDDGR